MQNATWQYVVSEAGKNYCWDDSDEFNFEQVKEIATCMKQSMDKYTTAQFMWTARNEFQAKWDYIRAWNKGWINTTALNFE